MSGVIADVSQQKHGREFKRLFKFFIKKYYYKLILLTYCNIKNLINNCKIVFYIRSSSFYKGRDCMYVLFNVRKLNLCL